LLHINMFRRKSSVEVVFNVPYIAHLVVVVW